MQIANFQKLKKQISKMEQNGETAMKRTVSDMKRRLPGPIATEVRKFYKIDAAEINPTSTKATQGKAAASIKIEGKTVASLALVYEGRVLTPQGHGFMLNEAIQGNGRKRIKVKFKTKERQKELKGRYGTTFLARSKKGSETRIPFQRVPSTNAIEAVRTVAVPEMIDNEDVNAEIYERIGEIVNKRIENNFKKILDG